MSPANHPAVSIFQDHSARWGARGRADCVVSPLRGVVAQSSATPGTQAGRARLTILLAALILIPIASALMSVRGRAASGSGAPVLGACSGGPEIDVLGGSGPTPIPDGAISPNATDGTDFGSADVGNALSHDFTIKNTGTGDLNISGVTAGGDFTVLNPTLFPVIVTAGNSTTLTVRFQPTTTGPLSATVHIASDDCDEADYDFAIQGTGATGACPPIVVDPSALPNGVQDAPYSQTITASGGTGPYTFAFTGSLPDGLSLSSDGILDGSPSTPGTFTFTVTATDSSNVCTGSREYTVVINSCPASLTVTSTGDKPDVNPGDGVCADSYGKCTLRAAIQEANALGGCVQPLPIDFCIPVRDPGHVYYKDDGTGSGHVTSDGTHVVHTSAGDDSSIGDIDPDYAHSWWRITPATPLPAIEVPVTINGYSQPGSRENCKHLNQGDDAILRVELDGVCLSQGGGLDLECGAGGSSISGLVINHFAEVGILLGDEGYDAITGNFIGTDVSGTLAQGSTGTGISIVSGDTDIIGGDEPAQRNLISGHESGSGVDICGAADNSIEGNYIGTDRNGSAALGNKYGVTIRAFASDNFVGCEVLDGDNVISGNCSDGVLIKNACSNTVMGNFIGTDRTGCVALPNGGDGVEVRNASDNYIGVGEFGNLISGNGGNGVLIKQTNPSMSSQSNLVQGNFIGTNLAGKTAIPNTDAGVELDGSSCNLVGGFCAGEGNVISGNGGDGVEITGGASDNTVQGNFIGLKADCNGLLGNQGSGVEIYEEAEIHGSTRNLIGFQQSVVVEQNQLPRLDAKTQSSTPVKTINGTSFSPAWALPPPVIVGNTSGANVIAGNGVDGVRISNPGDINNVITENSIYSNGGRGINLVGGSGETNGVTPNDLGTPPDTDTGPNNFQNFPDLLGASSVTGVITGELYSTPSSCFRIEFFGNATCDGNTSGVSSGTNGEGQTFLGSKDVYTDSNGHVLFTSDPLTLTGVPIVTATATAKDVDDDNDGGEVTPPVTHTSEFSACQVVTGPPTADLGITKTASPGPTAVVGNNLTYEMVVNNYGPDAAVGVVVTDTLPANVTYVSSSVSQGTGCSGAPSLICDLGTINNGGSATVQIIVTVEPAALGTDVSNTATVSSKVSEPGSDPHTNSATATTHIDSCPTTFTVTSNGDTDDAVPGDGHCDTNAGTLGDQCTLRAAIEEANALPACGTIDINFSGVASPINLGGTALPNINHDVNINGPGANLLAVQRSSASTFRIFTIGPARTVAISGLTISNGSSGIGGGIYNNRGTLTITNCAISGNTASSFGGGIHNGGSGSGNAALTIIGSTISGNSSAGDGGGVYSDAGSGTASLTMINSTVSGNTANNHVGGVYVISSPATLTNITITNNHADNDNTAGGAAGGLSESSGTVTLHNTIVAGNFRGSANTTRDDINGSLQAASSYNLVGDGTGMFGISDGDLNHNHVGSSGAPIDPLITPLANNGGPTWTHATLYNSPAIDKGDNLVTGSPLNLATDQRGALYNRQENGDLIPGAVVDIGAYERQATEKRKVPNGQTVPVDLVDARLTFPCVPALNCGGTVTKRDGGQTRGDISPDTTANNALITVIDPSLQPTPPSGYVVGANSSPVLPAFDVTGPGSFDTPVQICFYLPTITNVGFFDGLKILHNEGGVLVPVPSSKNFASKLVCGSVSSLSPFVVASTVTPTAANGDVRGQIVDSNGNPVEGAAVRMSGTQNRLTVTDAAGNYRFDNVETNGFYTVAPARANYSFSPSQRSFSALGQHTDATFNATAAGNALNPLDTSEYFVRQQYLDFLGREPDEAGLNFWVNNIESCGADANCRTAKRTDTSAAFFLSIEFQQTGYLVYRAYQAAYGDLLGAPVPIKLGEFKPDTAEIANGVMVNQPDWQTTLERNKVSFMAGFVQRSRFTSAYSQTLTPTEFVDALFVKAGVTPAGSDRAAAINEFGPAPTSADLAARGRVLRRVAENSVLARQEFNQAFVLMQYLGYLRRDANSRPDADFSGFSFWLEKLNAFDGNFGNAEMVKAFLVSSEYRGRFPR